MMLKTLPLLLLALLLGAALACAPSADRTAEQPAAAELSAHKVAEATLTAHYIAAALEAGKTPAEINATLQQIASETIIDEFWVSDANGVSEFTSVPGGQFSYGMDPDADRQAAPFVNLILGKRRTLVQEPQPRDSDGAMFQYVGVAGVDGPRIVQVGFRQQ